MSIQIRINDELYTRLEKHAEGFDTPEHVIERLLNHYEGNTQDRTTKQTSSHRRRDTTKYIFNGETYGKGRLVLAVIKKHITDDPQITLQNLQADFPKELQYPGSIGVINKLEYVETKFSEHSNKRHYIKPDELIKIEGGVIAVCTQWGIDNIENFIAQAKKLGHEITVVAP